MQYYCSSDKYNLNVKNGFNLGDGYIKFIEGELNQTVMDIRKYFLNADLLYIHRYSVQKRLYELLSYPRQMRRVELIISEVVRIHNSYQQVGNSSNTVR